MTIDQYLEEERRRGNIITGGGCVPYSYRSVNMVVLILCFFPLRRPQSETQLTKKELLALAAEIDGTAEGDEKDEEKRQEDERWAQFKDKNPRGWGNTMNRG